MHTPDEQPWDGGDLLEEITVANVEDLRGMRRNCAVTVAIRHADVPAEISFGTIYVQAPLGHVLETLAAYLPEIVRDLETRIPSAWGASLSPTDFWDSIHGEGLAVPRVVRDSPVE